MEEEGIESVILYGSYGRGEENLSSDLDICVIVSNEFIGEITIDKIDHLLSLKFIDYIKIKKIQINIDQYDINTLNSMLKSGSLFLWHLKLEGKVIYGKEFFLEKVKSLTEFKNHINELNYYHDLFHTMSDDQSKYYSISNFDYSFIFTLVRNVSTVLVHKFGFYIFDKIEVVRMANELFEDFPFSLESYKKLSINKIAYERSNSVPSDKKIQKEYSKYVDSLHNLIIFSINKIKLSENDYGFGYLFIVFSELIKEHKVEIGYLEKLRVERALFTILNLFLIKKMNFEVTGFSSTHREYILNALNMHKAPIIYFNLIERLFNLNFFIKKISSSNAYVRGDAYYGTGIEKHDLYKVLKKHVYKIGEILVSIDNNKNEL